MISFRPLTARLAKAAGAPPLEAQAKETIEWAPASKAFAPPLIQLPDEIDRVTAFNSGLSRDEYIAQTLSREVDYPPTIARRYNDALIASGSVYVGASMQVIHQIRRKLALVGTPINLSERILTTNFVAERYFGHWLLDGIALELLAEGRGIAPIGLARETWLQEPEYRAVLDLRLERYPLARIQHLWLVDDRSTNADHARRIRELRRRARRGVTPANVGKPVFLRREGGVKRTLLNQDVLCDALDRRGFAILTPERENVETLRSTLVTAPFVVSVEGSALCHGIALLPDTGTIVAIQPPRRVDWIQKVWTDAAGLRLAQTVASDAGADGFLVDEDRLLRLLDLVERKRDGS